MLDLTKFEGVTVESTDYNTDDIHSPRAVFHKADGSRLEIRFDNTGGGHSVFEYDTEGVLVEDA